MTYRILRSARRTLALEIRADLEVLVRAPQRTGLRHIEAFVEQHAGWIEKTRARMLARRERRFKSERGHTGGIFYEGTLFPFCVDPALSERFAFCGTAFRIHPLWANEAQKIAEAWFRREAAQRLPGRVHDWVSRGAAPCKKIRTGGARTLWGSCSARGVITLNWRLLMSPPAVADYVVIHELCHLQEMNHSRDFWKKVSAFCPAYREACAWLREHGDLLLCPFPEPAPAERALVEA